MKPKFPALASYASAAWMLDCEPAALQAIAEVESGTQGAFLSTDEPVILYEPHIFHRLTGGKYDNQRVADAPPNAKWTELSYEKWRSGTYGPMSVQHKKLQAAVLLDRDAALMSCSWGLFQIIPSPSNNYCGMGALQFFINMAYGSADDHLRLLVMFIRMDGRLVDAIRNKDWEAFAATYNGPGFTKNNYDTKISEAYKSLTEGRP